MRSADVGRRSARVATFAFLLAGLASPVVVMVLLEKGALRATEVLGLVVLCLELGLAGAIGACMASSASNRDQAVRRALGWAAFAAALPLLVIAAVQGESHGLLFSVLFLAWGAVLVLPCLPVVYAVLDASRQPSHDALDRVTALAGGFLVAVKLPEGVALVIVGPGLAAALSLSIAAVGAIIFTSAQIRRRRRAHRVAAILSASERGEAVLVAESEPTERAIALWGSERLAVVTNASGYRNSGRVRETEVIPRAFAQPSTLADLADLGVSFGIASFIALGGVGLWLLARSC